MAAGRRAWVMTPVAWIAAGHQGGSGAVTSRIVLVAVAVLAVSAFAVLQLKARSHRPRSPSEPGRRRRRYDPSDWRTLPPPYWPEGRNDEAPFGNEERHRPDWRYGYPPGYDPYPRYDPCAGDAADDRVPQRWEGAS
jgi:hypothetical protein